MWLRERTFFEYLCFSTIPKRRERPNPVGVPRICELLHPVEPDYENNGVDATGRRARGRVMARPWTVCKWPGTVVRR